MSLQFACPHCSSALLLPEGCGGKTAKCPACSREFIIPGGEAPEAAVPVGAVLAPVEQSVTQAEVDEAQAAAARLMAQHVGLQAEVARRAHQRRQLATRLDWLKRIQSARRLLDHSLGRAGGFFVGVTVGTALLVVLASVFSPSALGYFMVLLVGLVICTAAFGMAAFYPDDARLALAIPPLEEKLGETAKAHERLAAEEERLGEELTAANETYKRLRAAFASRLPWLRTCQWQQMNSKSLVTFLTQVFEEHGYTVEPTGKKGQQGIDLVVARDGVRVAVQAKGIQAGPVEQHVIQQTHAGMAYFKCQRAAVVTNAQLMPSARQLADTLGCTLIDAARMPDFIEGRISV